MGGAGRVPTGGFRLLTQRYAGAIAVLLALLFASAVLATDGDAGTDRDAGDTWGSALAVSYGTHAGTLSPSDGQDWFRVNDQSSTPVCIDAAVTPGDAVRSALQVSSPSGTRTVTLDAAAAATERAGIVVRDLTATHLGVSGNSTSYSFSLDVHDLAPTSGEDPAGSDAGDVLTAAFAADRSCIAGHLAHLVDETDLFAIVASAGETIYYSMAASNVGPTVVLLDASGSPVGFAVASGEMAGYFVENTGTFYLSASRATSTAASSDYIIGLIVGPDPPTQGCRPTCRVAS